MVSRHQDQSPTQPGVVGAGPTAVVPLATALAGGTDGGDEAWRVATDYALRGRSLEDLLADVDGALVALGRPAADGDLLRGLAVAWSEAMLSAFNRISCADPLTGLATVQHLVAQLQERAFSLEDHALLVVDVPPRGGRPPDRAAASLADAAAVLDVGAVVAEVLPGCRTPARLGEHRCGVVVDRASTAATVPRRLADAVADRLELTAPPRRRVRVALRPLPGDLDAAAAVVDALCR